MPYTKDQARTEIANLVANFRANEPSLADVPEAQIEDTYIRRLFHFLNWNVANTGLSVAEWEFILQRTDEKVKRPDYVLQLDGQQLLVMDAKVDYIVENTVGELLAKCKTPAEVAKLRILDPACGSGSFLLGAYSTLIHMNSMN
jgi:hypothetical protein